LPDGVGILGVDEHTAVIIDLDARTMTVKGKGDAHWRLRGSVSDFPNASVISLEDLGARARVLEPLDELAPPTATVVDESEVLELRAAQARLVDALNALRATARSEGNYALADEIRDAITAAGVVVRDGAVAS